VALVWYLRQNMSRRYERMAEERQDTTSDPVVTVKLMFDGQAEPVYFHVKASTRAMLVTKFRLDSKGVIEIATFDQSDSAPIPVAIDLDDLLYVE
jgi:hypothetical protein